MGCVLLLVIVVLTEVLVYGHCYTHSDMDNLSNYLFNESRYNPRLRPVVNQSDIIQIVRVDCVVFGLQERRDLECNTNISQSTRTIWINASISIWLIEEYDIANGDIEIAGYITLTWIDTFLTWSPTSYGNIDTFSLNPYTFWTPSVQLIRSAMQITSTNTGKQEVTYDGRVSFTSIGYFGSKCIIDIRKYPFDRHRCAYMFYSNRYAASEVEFRNVSLNINGLKENENWHLEDETISNEDVFIGLTKTNTVRVWFTIRRRPAFILLHTGLPISLTVLLNMFPFFLPTDSEERTSFSLTVFMSFIFLVIPISAEMPSNSMNVSSFSILFGVNLFLSTFLIMWNITVNRLSKLHHDQNPIPRFFHRLAQFRMQTMCCTAGHNTQLVRPEELCSMDKLKTLNARDGPIKDNDHAVKNSLEKAVLDKRSDKSSEDTGSGNARDTPSWKDVAEAMDTVMGITFSIVITACGIGYAISVM